MGEQNNYALEVHGTRGLVRWDFRRPGELQVSSGDQYAGQPTSTVFSEPGDGEYAAFQPGAGIAMGYDDTKVVEARNFVRAISGEAAELATLDDAVASRERARRDGGLARDRGVGERYEQGRGLHGRHRAGAADPPDRGDRAAAGSAGCTPTSWPARCPGYAVAAVADAVPEAALGVSATIGAPVLSIEELLASDDVDTVAICTSTDTHVDLVIAAAESGKAIFCEKPVSLDLRQVDRALAAVEAAGVPFMIGFNRRFDPGHKSVRDRVADGSVGDLHVLRITSRDPAAPPPEYVAVSGGIFLDMVIHDFDMANYVVGSPVVEVFARGAVRVDPRIGEAGDVDTAVTVLTHEDGTLTTIDNSREAVYGFDQRVEAFGSAGMAVSDNPAAPRGLARRPRGARPAQPLPWFFLDRYLESYRQEWGAFHTYLTEGGPSPVGTADARACTTVALAAGLSLREGRPVQVKEIGVTAPGTAVRFACTWRAPRGVGDAREITPV